MKSPIFLLGAHKSGTSLLRSLFDGHPDLFVIPKETHLFQMSGYWVDYRLRRAKPQEMTKKAIIEAFAGMIEKYNTAVNPQADSITLGRWDVTAFRQSLESADLSNTRALFTAVFQAMHQSLYGHTLNEQKRIVEKSVEHAEFALDLNALFPEARFIHIIRNPYANLVSLSRFKSANGYPFLKGIIFSLYNSYYHLWRNIRLLDNYLVIRYEDLVTEPENIMTKLAQFVNISFQDILLHPTSQEEMWTGNSVYSSQFSGISTASLHKWQSEIYGFEIKLLNKIVPKLIMSKYAYKRLQCKDSLYKPMPSESIKTYLGNRFLQYYI